MKRFLSILLVACMILGLVACGGAASSSEAAPASSEEAAPASSEEAAPASSEEAAPASSEEAAPSEEPAGEMPVMYSNMGAVDFFQVPWFNANLTNSNKFCFETLVGMNADYELTNECGMSDDFNISEDGLTATVHLRDGLMWHDGEPVTADDVVFSIEKGIINGSTLISTILNTFRNLEGAEEYVAGTAEHVSGITVDADGKTITLKFAKVVPNLQWSLGEFAILPQHLLKDADFTQLQQDPFFQKPIGSGPFYIEEVKMNEYTIYAPFEQYWNGVANFKIQCSANQPETDPDLPEAFRAGQLDYAFVKNYDQMKACDGLDGVHIHTVSALYTRWLNVNEHKHAEGEVNQLADPRVRQAIAYAIDRKGISEGLFQGATIPGDGTLTPTGHEWKKTGLETYDYNPDKAKELLAEVGWDSSRVLKIVYYYTDQQTVDLMSIIQQELAEVGIQSEPYLATGDLGTALNSLPVVGNEPSWSEDAVSTVEWDLCYGALAATTILNYYERFGAGMNSNNAHPVTEEMQALTDALFGTANVEEQKAAYAAFEEWQSKEMKIIPLYYSPYWVITTDKVEGNVEKWANPQFGWNWDIQHWTLH